MSNVTMAVSGVLFLMYFVTFMVSAVWYYRGGIEEPPLWWVIVFTPILAVLYLMIWVLFPIDHELRKRR